MIQNNFNFYVEKNKLIQELEELKTQLQTKNYNEGILDIIGKFAGDVSFYKQIEVFKDEVIKNLTNWLFRNHPRAVVVNMKAEYSKFLEELNKKNIPEETKTAVYQYTQQLLQYFIDRVVLKEENSKNKEGLEQQDVQEIEQTVKDVQAKTQQQEELTPQEIDDIKQANQQLENEPMQFGDTEDSTTGELPENIEDIINRYLKGNAPGNPRELIKELVGMSKDQKVRQSGNSIRGVINLMSGLVLMTRKAANSEDVRAIRNFILDVRKKLTASNKNIGTGTQTQTQTGATPPAK